VRVNLGRSSPLTQNRLHLALEGWQVALHGGPDFLQVHTRVVMNQDIPHGDDLRPGDFGVSCTQGFRNPPRRLTNDLKVIYNPDLYKLVTLERLPTTRSIAFVRSTASRMSNRRSRSSLTGTLPLSRCARECADEARAP